MALPRPRFQRCLGMFRNNAYIDRLYPTDYSEQFIIIENPHAFFGRGSAAIRHGFGLSAAFARFLEVSPDPPTVDLVRRQSALTSAGFARAPMGPVGVSFQIAPYSSLTDLPIFE